MHSVSDYSLQKKSMEKVGAAKAEVESQGGSQRQQGSSSCGDEFAHTHKLHPEGINVTTLGQDATRICTEGDANPKLEHVDDSMPTGENEVTTATASAPVQSPSGETGSEDLVSDDSLDRILDAAKLLRDVDTSQKPFLNEESPGTAEGGKLEKISSENAGGNSPFSFDVHGDSQAIGFDPGRRRVSILSMDGGGMRGLLAARILAHLESLLKTKTGGEVNLCDYFDFLAGTSTGAILTTMLITPDKQGQPLFTAQECCRFYSVNGKHIFQPRWYDVFKGKFRQFYRPKYSARRFERLLKSYLVRDGKELTMRDTLKPFLVTSFDISESSPFIFVRHAAMKDESKNFRLWEVCRGTAAAPTYFKPAEVSSIDGRFSGVLIDGGAIQNNPSLVAATHVIGNEEDFPNTSGLKDLLILSLGAGQLDEKHEAKAVRKWGLTGWVRPLLNIMMDGSSDTIDYQLASAFAGHSCSENYLRIQLSGLPRKTSLMDCTTKENIQDLINCADELLQQKAVMRNATGEKITLNVTYAERLSWFADQLIIQKRLRDEQGANPPPAADKYNLGPIPAPQVRLVSPLINNLFIHSQTNDSSLTEHLKKAKSLRY
ncbi:hypothetical protein R1sor_003667 [Riccia sorocarpa]|uniref:Patatin n=1 Tax=Riccia sorocarpa TaxID=122646 RepID=A0ABD3H5M3_9MARC